MRLRLTVVLGGLALLAAGPATAAEESVTIQGFAFSPADLNVEVGDSVTWTNQDSAPHTATSTSGPASFDSGTLNQGASFTFDVAGTYEYRCDFHTSMTATVTVAAAGDGTDNTDDGNDDGNGNTNENDVGTGDTTDNGDGASDDTASNPVPSAGAMAVLSLAAMVGALRRRR